MTPRRLAVVAAFLLAVNLSAQEPPTRREFHASRLEGTVRVDGTLDDAAWGGPASFELTLETSPAENGPAPVRTEVWIAYDDSNLYAAFRAHDPDPKQIRGRYSDHDAAFNDDFVGVVLDTFHDQRRAFEFFVNPLGVQMDLTMNEVTGNEDSSWDAIWDSAGRITADGYEVELRIPFSSLRFPAMTGEMTWGIDSVRNYPRGPGHRLGLHPLQRGNNCYLCQASTLSGITGVRPARSIELDPTITASRNGERTDFPDGPVEDDDPNFELGLTGHWGMTPNFTLSGAINPDFSQVEADIAQLSVNTQFALFYPEKRPFFLEGADLFETRFQAIYSRNIADPEWGVKLTGKSGKNALGLILSVDRQTNFLIPSSQGSGLAFSDDENLSTILRYRRDLFGATTGGLFYTGREGDGYHNRLLGGDVLFRWQEGKKAMRVEMLGSTTQYPDSVVADTGQSADELKDWALRTVFQHTSRDWTWYLLYRDIGEDFRADLGFVPRVDFREKGVSLEHAWYPEKSPWTQVRAGTEASDIEDQSGEHLERHANFYSWANGPRQSFLRIDLTAGDQNYGGETFDRNRVTLYGEFQASADLYLYSQLIAGKQVDFSNAQQGDQIRVDPGLRWNAGKHLRLNLDHSYETLDVDGGRLFTANLTQLRATYQLNNRTFFRWIGQNLDVESDPDLYSYPVDEESQNFFNQFLFSYKINPLTVVFLGYSDTYAGNQDINLLQANRTLFFKVGYAWQV